MGVSGQRQRRAAPLDAPIRAACRRMGRPRRAQSDALRHTFVAANKGIAHLQKDRQPSSRAIALSPDYSWCGLEWLAGVDQVVDIAYELICKKTTRYQLPGKFGWPNRLFLLDRCALEHRFPVKNGKELIVFNVHNSAYDKDGSIKKLQTQYLKERWLAEYEAGNYVIIGGDWNQVPPFFDPNFFHPTIPKRKNANIDPELMPNDWRWIYDPTVPTVRDTREVYTKNQTYTQLIDFFLISPNLQALQVNGLDLDFQFSDHQPVSIKIVLK